ncbi:MAG: hypothetical protein KDD62_10550 [Bdellovibrionales bacterium]|nr:hypothetical protein [Bdellovibrionales bacterium]
MLVEDRPDCLSEPVLSTREESIVGPKAREATRSKERGSLVLEESKPKVRGMWEIELELYGMAFIMLLAAVLGQGRHLIHLDTSREGWSLIDPVVPMALLLVVLFFAIGGFLSLVRIAWKNFMK